MTFFTHACSTYRRSMGGRGHRLGIPPMKGCSPEEPVFYSRTKLSHATTIADSYDF
ncbi:hypothetical protein L537_0356 [Bordetella hinzii 1277]|nr:hypothetical protein L537_0356 [Bordetella hinzii 1277]